MFRHLYMPLFIFLFSVSLFAETNLYLFFPVQIRPKALEEKLNSIGSDVKVTVFGRYRDFIDRTKMDQPDAILAKDELIKELPSYSKAYVASFKGTHSSSYALLSLDKEFSSQGISGNTIGIVDIMGKKSLEKKINSSFSTAPLLKRVRKLEDLLPLLMFQMVPAVIIDVKDLDYYRNRSNAELFLAEIPKLKTSIATISIKDGKSKAAIKSLVNSFTPELKTLIGVDQWK